MIPRIPRKDWIWFIVVDDDGNFEDGFNSEIGANQYAEEYGGTVIPVKETKE